MKKQPCGIILAGGKSSRMGKDKCLLTVENQFFIEKVISVLKNFTGKILISANAEVYSRFGYETVSDKFKNCGPMCGIFSALQASKCHRNIVLPCDMPFISPKILEILIKHPAENIWAVYKNKVYPTVGIYSAGLLPVLEEKIRNKQFKLMTLEPFFEKINFDTFDEKCFVNVNTPGDYKKISAQ